MRGRKIVPIVYGDAAARWTVALLIPVWSLAVIKLWEADRWSRLALLVIGLIVSIRIVSKNGGVRRDKKTFKI